MSVDKSFLLQKQVRDNSEDLQNEFLDMKNWEQQMKRKDEELRKKSENSIVLPPIRNKKKKKAENSESKDVKSETNKKRIMSYDYSTWDKFDVEKACKEIDKTDISEESEEELSKEELTKNHNLAEERKQKGNMFVQQKEWDKAIGCYSEAIKLFPYDAIFYANRALCHLKKDNLYCTEADCSTAIQLDSNYVKAYHRRATARIELKQYKEAKKDLEAVLKLEPFNKEAKSMLVQVNKKIEASKPVVISNEDIAEDITIEKKIGEKLCGLKPKPKEIEKKLIESKMEEEKQMNKELPIQVKDKEVKSKSVQEMKIKFTESKPQIPDWLPEKNNVEIIQPIQKPPHLQSKKPMKQITVKEAEFGITKCNKQTIDIPKEKDLQLLKASDTTVNNTENILKERNDLKNVPEDRKDVTEIPVIPRTAVQFLMDWRKRRSSEYRYQYLKQLPSGSLAKIFQDSMESDIFSEILVILKTEFTSHKDPVYQYLKDLSQVKRFRALIMFITNSEKKGLQDLLKYCKEVENRSQEDIVELCSTYELTY